MRVPGERCKKMERRGQRCGPQPAGCTIARKYQRIESILFAQCAAHANLVDEGDEAIAAVQKDVLSVVDLAPGDFERRRAPTEEPRTLEDLDLIAPIA